MDNIMNWNKIYSPTHLTKRSESQAHAFWQCDRHESRLVRPGLQVDAAHLYRGIGLNGDAEVHNLQKRMDGDDEVHNLQKRMNGDDEVHSLQKRMNGDDEVHNLQKRMDGDDEVHNLQKRMDGEGIARRTHQCTV